jgi:hypothetical protein
VLRALFASRPRPLEREIGAPVVTLTRSRLIWIIAIPCVLVITDVALWWLLGEKALERGLPSIVREDLGGKLQSMPYGLDIKDVVVLQEDHPPLAPDVMHELRAAFARAGRRAHLESDLAARGTTYLECCRRVHKAPSEAGEPCVGFSFGVGMNTPLIANVYTTTDICTGGSSVFVHRRLWLFGVWLPLSHDMVGQE